MGDVKLSNTVFNAFIDDVKCAAVDAIANYITDHDNGDDTKRLFRDIRKMVYYVNALEGGYMPDPIDNFENCLSDEQAQGIINELVTLVETHNNSYTSPIGTPTAVELVNRLVTDDWEPLIDENGSYLIVE